MKQKIISTMTVFGLMIGMSFLLFDTPTFAQRSETGIINEATGEVWTQAEIDAANESGTMQCGDVKTSIIGGDDICNEDAEGGIIFNLLKWVLRIMTAGVGIAAVGGIAYGALLYTTAESKPDQTKKAISIISNVVIGIVAYALMAVLLDFLIPGGVFR